MSTGTGPIECRGGPFDGTVHVWPITGNVISLLRRYGQEQHFGVYRDSGRKRVVGCGEPVRIFDLSLDETPPVLPSVGL